MKKLAILIVSLSSLVLFSFILPPDGIKKIGKNLWEVSPKANFSAADRTNLENLIKKEYNLKDFRTTVNLDFKTNARGVWVLVKNHVGPNFVDKKLLAGEWKERQAEAMEGSAKEIKGILGKYTPDNKIDDK